MKRSLRLGGVLLLAASWCACQRPVVAPENSAVYERAQRAVEANDYPSAAAAYRVVLEQYPRFARAHLELGLLADEKLADPVIAIYHYRRCLELEPSADKRRVIEDYLERAKLSLAARLPKPEAVDTSELVRLQNQNTALMLEVTGLKRKVADLEAALQTAQTATPTNSGPVVAAVGPPASVMPPTPTTATNTGPVVASTRPAYHEVVRGDTLYSIALRYYGARAAWEKIYRANQSALPNRDQLRIGQRLVLP